MLTLLQFFESGPVGFEFPAPHGALFAAARQAAREHVKLPLAGQELDPDIAMGCAANEGQLDAALKRCRENLAAL